MGIQIKQCDKVMEFNNSNFNEYYEEKILQIFF